MLELAFDLISSLCGDRANLISQLNDSELSADLNAILIDVSTDDAGHSIGIESRLSRDDICMSESDRYIVLKEMTEGQEGFDVVIKVSIVF